MTKANVMKGSNTQQYDSFTLSLEEDECFDDTIDLLDVDNSLSVECKEFLWSSQIEEDIQFFATDNSASFSTADYIERMRKRKRKMSGDSSILIKRSQSPALTEKSLVTESSNPDFDGSGASSFQTVPTMSLVQFDRQLELSAMRLSESIKRSRISRSRVLMFQEP